MSKTFTNHNLNLTKSQAKQLMKGGAISLKASQMTDDGDHQLQMLPANSKKIMSAMKKGKGVRITFKPKECVINKHTKGNLITELKDGTGFWDDLGNAFDPNKNGVAQAFSPGGVVEKVSKGVAKDVISTVLPAAASGLAGLAFSETGPGSIAAGAAAGIAGRQVANIINEKIGSGIKRRGKGMTRSGKDIKIQDMSPPPPPVEGDGLFQTIHAVTGIGKTAIIKAAKNTAKRAGKAILSVAAAAAGEALATATESPAAGHVLTTTINAAANHLLQEEENITITPHETVTQVQEIATELAKKEIVKIVKSKTSAGSKQQDLALKAVEAVTAPTVVNPHRTVVVRPQSRHVKQGSNIAEPNHPCMSPFHIVTNQYGSHNPIRGGSIVDAKFSIRDAVDAGRDIGSLFGRGLYTSGFRGNGLHHGFDGDGQGLYGP